MRQSDINLAVKIIGSLLGQQDEDYEKALQSQNLDTEAPLKYELRDLSFTEHTRVTRITFVKSRRASKIFFWIFSVLTVGVYTYLHSANALEKQKLRLTQSTETSAIEVESRKSIINNQHQLSGNKTTGRISGKK